MANRKTQIQRQLTQPPKPKLTQPVDLSSLDPFPINYQTIFEYFGQFQEANLFALREETFRRIEKITNRPLICYITKTHDVPQGIPAYIDDGDLIGFTDLISSIDGDELDIFLISNGGYPEATERIVNLLHGKFKSLHFIIPANAYSAATMMCFSGDEIIMGSAATLGPIDPQMGGVPVGAILDGFQVVVDILKAPDGAKALPAYLPLIQKYDLSTFQMCRAAQDLSKELAAKWLSKYMLNCQQDDPDLIKIVEFFASHTLHKSHSRAIDRDTARVWLHDKIIDAENNQELGKLMNSLVNQYEFWFNTLPGFYKMYENAHGTSWGRQSQTLTVQLPIPPVPGQPQPAPQPGQPRRS